MFQSMPASSFGLHGFLMFNRIQGGTEKNVDPGFSKWAGTIEPNVLEYIPSSAKLSEMVQTGEAAIFPFTPTATTQKARGVPMEYAQPKEGSVLLMVAECVTANNDNAAPATVDKFKVYMKTVNPLDWDAVKTAGVEHALEQDRGALTRCGARPVLLYDPTDPFVPKRLLWRPPRPSPVLKPVPLADDQHSSKVP